jgi:hypothetical protein
VRSCDSCSDRLIDTRKAVAPIPTEGDPDDHFLCRSGSLDTWVLNLRTSDKEQLDSGRAIHIVCNDTTRSGSTFDRKSLVRSAMRN